MARVIKGGQAPSPRRALPKLKSAAGKKVIEKELYRAQQVAEQIMADAEAERARMLQAAKQQAAQAREEASAEGAEEAFAQAAQEALQSFRLRAERYAEAADDIRILALEVVSKIMNADLELDPREVDAIIKRGMDRLRARRKLRIQVSAARKAALVGQRPILLQRLEDEPDLVVEAAPDVGPGFARVVTEVGGALCAEQTAFDSLAEALGVKEQAVAPRPQSTVVEVKAESTDAGWSSSEEWGSDHSDATEYIAREQVAKNKRPRVSLPKGRPVPADAEATMALDVAGLRDELDDEPSDLDLFADDSFAE